MGMATFLRKSFDRMTPGILNTIDRRQKELNANSIQENFFEPTWLPHCFNN